MRTNSEVGITSYFCCVILKTDIFSCKKTDKFCSYDKGSLFCLQISTIFLNLTITKLSNYIFIKNFK